MPIFFKKIEHVDKQKLRFLLVTCWYNPASNDLLIDSPVDFVNSTFKFRLLHGDANFALNIFPIVHSLKRSIS